MKFMYVDNLEKWVNKGIEDLINEYGQPFERCYSPDGSGNSDVLQDLLDMRDPEFMLEHTRQGNDGILLVDVYEFEYFDRLMTQVSEAEELYAEMNRLHHELGNDPAADPLWDAYEERVRLIKVTAEYIKERPADTLEQVNLVYRKYLTTLKNYLEERDWM